MVRPPSRSSPRSLYAGVLCFHLIAGTLAAQSPLRLNATADSSVAAADSALAAGRPFEATRILSPVLDDRGRRTPAAVLLAARAAAGWQGWTLVDRLLSDAPWLDAGFAGAGRELLAKAALARNRDSLSLAHAKAALAASLDDSTRAARGILAARAMERMERYDSAPGLYLASAARFPSIRDWLALRAAGASKDSAARAGLYAGLTGSAARARIQWTEALALTRLGDREGAARIYDGLGTRVTAVGLRIAAAPTPAVRNRLRADLVALLTPRLSNDESRAAIDLLDRAFRPLAPSEELSAARRAAGIGSLERAAAGYGQAAREGVLTSNDRYTWGTVLVRLGREREAIAQFDRVKDPALLGQAAYQRARALLRAGAGGEAEAALVIIPQRFASDTEAASTALYLAADLRTDAGDDERARELFAAVGRRYPSSRFADRARFRAAFIAMINGDVKTALTEWDALLRDRPSGDEQTASLYWSGRARFQLGDTVGAIAKWAQLVARQDGGYYVTLAATALGQRPWSAVDGGAIPIPADVAAALQRARLLGALGLQTESRFEIDGIERNADQSAMQLAGTAQGLSDAGYLSRGMRLAQRALARGAPRTEALYRLIYPFPERETVEREAARQGLDPFLVAGLIRQESAFDPAARSVADARGLMQVLPRVGAELARSQGIGDWDPVLLYQPEISIAFGTQHLAETSRLYATPERVLAAYNAGVHRVQRWDTKAAVATDPTVFVERIPYVETRDYVRRVQSNRTVYQLLYRGADQGTSRVP